MNTRYLKLDTRNTRPVTRNSTSTSDEQRVTSNGFDLPLVLVAIVILMALIIGTTMTDYHARLRAVKLKSQTEAMLAAEAGYERAIFWMSQQSDILSTIGTGNGSIDFGSATCSYTIAFHGWLGQKAIFEVTSTGVSGRPSFTRIVDVNVIQETCGWAMGACMVPLGTSIASESPVYFKNGEVINMPLHINKQNDSPDVADIFITGSPTFLQKVEMGEDRYTSGNSDKYSSVMSFFQSGISFDQPTVRIADATAVQSKVTRFKNSTLPAYQFTPTAIAPDGGSLSSPKCSAVQLEFYVKNGVGMVRIDPNCTVQLHSAGTYDYNIVSGSNPMSFQQYKIYAYHFKKTSDPCIAVPLTSTYVTQTIGGYTSAPGGQIYVNGNVVIGGGEDANFTDMNNMVVRGTMTVVATGNIWIADSIWVDDNDSSGNHYQRDANGMPPANNPNVLGLIAQGVIKIVDPGLAGSTSPTPPANYTYRRIGIKKSGSTNRYLPDPTVVEAAMTVGGGGWGAENVGGRLMYSGSSDVLYVHGSITEVIRGVVNVGDPITNGYAKNYYIDTRLMSGILPGDIWLSGKYFPAPAGWHDTQSAD